jgi:superfamily II DNA or RNA helicase
MPILTFKATPATPATPAAPAPDLFPFQQEMVDLTYEAFQRHRRILWVAAPSCGKTRMSAMVAHSEALRGKRAAFVIEMNSLASQAAEDYADLGICTTSYWAKKRYNPAERIVVISAQTLESRIKRTGCNPGELLGPLDLLICDEAHATTQRQGWKVLAEGYPDAKILGMTGTPWNKGDRSLHHQFDHLISAPQPPDLIRMGRLVPVRGFHPKDLFDAADLKWKAGSDDFDPAAQQETAMGAELLQFTLRKWLEYGEGRSTIAYCTGISHAKVLTEIFNAAGIPAEFQIGSTSTTERAAQKARMSAGQTKILFSVGTCTKGYNLPIVSCVLLARAIGNKNLYHQTVCRGNRAYTCAQTGNKKNDCLLIDLGGNIERFGHLPTDYQDYSAVLAPPRPPVEWDAESDFKVCPNCGCGSVLLFARYCPNCDYRFGSDSDQGELFSTLDYQLEEYFSPLGCEQIQYLRSRKYRAFKEGTNPDEAIASFSDRFNFCPPNSWHQGAATGKQSTQVDRAAYFAYLREFSESADWIQQHMGLEFGGLSAIAPFIAKWKKGARCEH